MKHPPKTSNERKIAWRARKSEQGLKHCEIYAHPEDHPPIKAFAAKLNKKRMGKGNGS